MILAVALVAAVVSGHAFGLGPDDLLLITNKNVPEGRALAEFYAAQRKVPAGRIVELDLPPGEQISADAYDTVVAPTLRELLQKEKLVGRVTCLVTFYGMPLKVAGRTNAQTPQAGEDAAFDSELALLRWEGYPRRAWVSNPLKYDTPPALREKLKGVLMTMRLDAPKPEIVRAMITASLKAEAEGLKGKVVVDAGGHLALDAKNPAYGAFDRTLVELANIVRTKTTLPLVFDDRREVLPPGAALGVACYCGWYSVQKYVPSCAFATGAVGYHIASFELQTLRPGDPPLWVKGLLGDGIAATLGAVNEPFLSAFPRPDEFFPLLFTGKLTLAEVYWRTNPMASWRIAMIGDPLYTPFKANPALNVEALPAALQKAVPGAGGVR